MITGWGEGGTGGDAIPVHRPTLARVASGKFAVPACAARAEPGFAAPVEVWGYEGKHALDLRTINGALAIVLALAFAPAASGQGRATGETARPNAASPDLRPAKPEPAPSLGPAGPGRRRSTDQPAAGAPATPSTDSPEEEESPAPPGAAEEASPEPPPGAPHLPGGSVRDALAGRDLFHGNFCGYGSRVGALEPTDDLDAACKRHDECYEAAGQRACACDRDLRRDVVGIANSSRYSRELRTRAGTIAQAAELMSCVGP